MKSCVNKVFLELWQAISSSLVINLSFGKKVVLMDSSDEDRALEHTTE